jgi:hypothetical protein
MEVLMKLRFTKSLSTLTLLVAGLVLVSCGKDDGKLSPEAANQKQIVGLWHLTALAHDNGTTQVPVTLPANDPAVIRFNGKKANYVIFEGVTRPGSLSDVPADYTITQVNKLSIKEVTDSKGTKHPSLDLTIVQLDPKTLVVRSAEPRGVYYYTLTSTNVADVKALGTTVRATKIVNLE